MHFRYALFVYFHVWCNNSYFASWKKCYLRNSSSLIMSVQYYRRYS